MFLLCYDWEVHNLLTWTAFTWGPTKVPSKPVITASSSDLWKRTGIVGSQWSIYFSPRSMLPHIYYYCAWICLTAASVSQPCSGYCPKALHRHKKLTTWALSTFPRSSLSSSSILNAITKLNFLKFPQICAHSCLYTGLRTVFPASYSSTGTKTRCPLLQEIFLLDPYFSRLLGCVMLPHSTFDHSTCHTLLLSSVNLSDFPTGLQPLQRGAMSHQSLHTAINPISGT